MREVERFEKWVSKCAWPDETLQFHLYMYTNTFPGRVPRMLHELLAKHCDLDEQYDVQPKKRSYGYGDPRED